MADLQNPLTHEMDTLSNKINIDCERLNHEYNKYFGGAEQKPPIKLREQLDKEVARLQVIMKQSTNLGTTMRIQNAVYKANTYRAMWDKRLKLLEEGKKR
jgi:hypothetical protein